MYKYYSLILVIIIIFSCDHKKKNSSSYNTLNIISINPENVKKYKIENLINDYFYIKIDTDSNNYIKNIDKLYISEDKIFIGDISNHTIYIYNKNGKYISKIHDKGKGPGQYSSINDFCIDKWKKQIVINNFNQRKILFYNFEGVFLKELKTNLKQIRSIYKRNKNHFFVDNYRFNPTGKFDLIVTDTSFSKIKQKYFKKQNDYPIGFIPTNSFVDYNDKFLYNRPYSDTLYYFQKKGGESPVPAYKISFGKHWPPSSHFLQKINPDEIIDQAVKNKYVMFLNALETDQVLFLYYNYNNEIKNNIYLKRSKEVCSYSLKDNNLGLNMSSRVLNTYNDYIIYSISPYHLIDTKDANNQLTKIIENIEEFDNPVLLFISFKDNYNEKIL